MSPVVDVFCLRERFALSGAGTHVCVFDEKQAAGLVTRGEIDELFFGHVVYGSIPSEAGFAGVWGARNASRLRALLRSRGAKLHVQNEAPPGRLLTRTTSGKAWAKASVCS